MKSLLFAYSLAVLIFFISCKEKGSSIIATGQMPTLAKDETGDLHLVYGSGDTIMYAMSDNHGKSFSTSSLVAVLPKLAASHMRGPQIAATQQGVTIIACNTMGDIFSWSKDKNGIWKQSGKVNDVDTVAKEGLLALHGGGQTLFAAWLDLRDNGHNKIVGARSTDGGTNWSKNILIYASPDTSVCECCKPSVAVKGNIVYVMFRNWLNGNRDLYLIQSSDGGNSFGTARKLGTGSWPLNGCPMDGGGLAINTSNIPETVWNRQGSLFACEPGKKEIEIGSGRSCTIETVNGKNVYAWTENGEVIIRKPQGMKINLGKGKLPLIKSINNEHIVCVWEDDKQIKISTIEL